jgi:hypothetical protein
MKADEDLFVADGAMGPPMYARAPQACDIDTMAMSRGSAPATAKLGVCPNLRRQWCAASHAANITGTGPTVTCTAHQAKLHSVWLLREGSVIAPPGPPVDRPDRDDVDAGREVSPRQQSPTPRHDVSLTGDLLPWVATPARGTAGNARKFANVRCMARHTARCSKRPTVLQNTPGSALSWLSFILYS